MKPQGRSIMYTKKEEKKIILNESTNPYTERVLEISSLVRTSIMFKPVKKMSHLQLVRKRSAMAQLNELNIVVYGHSFTGKSTFGLKLSKKKLSNYYIPSLFLEIFKVPVRINDKSYLISITIPKSGDTKQILEANCYYYFFDISAEESFSYVSTLINEHSTKFKKPFFLIGNKCDKKRTVPKEDIEELKQKINCSYAEISALESIGLTNLMKVTIKAMIT